MARRKMAYYNPMLAVAGPRLAEPGLSGGSTIYRAAGVCVPHP
ncbi:hypothetical protein [Methylomonas sp. MgM2]